MMTRNASAPTTKRPGTRRPRGTGGRGHWTPRRLEATKRQLLILSAALRADIQRELRKYDDDRYAALADDVADSAELSVADLVADLDLAEIDRDVNDLRDVEAALRRLAAGSYGTCTDCSNAIHPARLERIPHAPRCLRCQQKFEGRAPKARAVDTLRGQR